MNSPGAETMKFRIAAVPLMTPHVPHVTTSTSSKLGASPFLMSFLNSSAVYILASPFSIFSLIWPILLVFNLLPSF